MSREFGDQHDLRERRTAEAAGSGDGWGDLAGTHVDSPQRTEPVQVASVTADVAASAEAAAADVPPAACLRRNDTGFEDGWGAEVVGSRRDREKLDEGDGPDETPATDDRSQIARSRVTGSASSDGRWIATSKTVAIDRRGTAGETEELDDESNEVPGLAGRDECLDGGYEAPADTPSTAEPQRVDYEAEEKLVNPHAQHGVSDAAKREEIAQELDLRPVLSPVDREAIENYTARGYLDLNSALSSGTLEDIAAIADRSAALSEALAKLPVREGTVLRGGSRPLSAGDIARYEPGDIVVESRYTSSTIDPEEEFSRYGGNAIWVIESKHGRSIEDLAVPEHRREAEVLFDRFARFRVFSRDYNEDLRAWIIYMEELG